MSNFIQYMTRASLYDGPFDNKSGWAAAGMGYITVTEEENLIVTDGGLPEDAAQFVTLLEQQCNGKTPEITLWIITHPHLDHFGVIKEISENQELKKRITVKKVAYWFPAEFCDNNGNPNFLASVNAEMEEICYSLGAEVQKPVRGEIFAIDDIALEFLYVPDDCSIFDTAGENANHCSLIFTIKGKNKKAMITGDAYGRSLQLTAWRYAKKLKCDILQMPHHALCDAYCVDFYRYVDPQIVFMPISVAGNRSMHSNLYDQEEGCIANLCVEAKADAVYKAFNGTTYIDI